MRLELKTCSMYIIRSQNAYFTLCAAAHAAVSSYSLKIFLYINFEHYATFEKIECFHVE